MANPNTKQITNPRERAFQHRLGTDYCNEDNRLTPGFRNVETLSFGRRVTRLPEPRTFEYSRDKRYQVPLSYGHNSLRPIDRFLSADYRLMPESFGTIDPSRFRLAWDSPLSDGYDSLERFRLSELRGYDLGPGIIKFHTALGEGLNKYKNCITITNTGRNPGKVHYRNARTGRVYTGNQSETVRYLSRTPAGNVVRRAPLVGTALSGVDILVNLVDDEWTVGENTAEAVGSAAFGWAGFKAGAWAGFKIGAGFKGFGAIPGALIGGIIGAMGGSWGGRRAGKAIHKQVAKCYK